MSLWGTTDAVASKPKWINLSAYPAGTQLVFVDATEAASDSNKSKGITGGGWWLYREYTDSDGNTRYWAENVVSIRKTTVAAGDNTDDEFVPDTTVTVVISAQPTNQTTVAGAATFSVTASINPAGTAEYQWQRKAKDSSRWVALAGQTNSTLKLTDQTVANTGDQYRVVVKGSGAKAVTSEPAKLTFGT